MVRVYGAVFGDVTDRAERSIGTISATEESSGYPQPLRLSQPQGVLVTPMPWASHYPWGRVIMHDDFESTLKWRQNAGTISRANDAGFVHGDLYSMKMLTGAVADDVASAVIRRQPPRGDSEYAVLEFHWALNAVAAATPRDLYLEWAIQDQNLAHTHIFRLRYLNYSGGVAKRQLQYWNAAGAWADIVGVTYKVNVILPAWQYFCLVLKRNVATGWQYYWGRMNDSEFMMNDLACQAGAFDLPEQMVNLVCTTDVAAATTAYVDDLTLLDLVQLHIS